MRSLHIRNWAGQLNLRGKRSKKLACGCCEVQDFRQRELAREARKDMREAWDVMRDRYLAAHPWLADDFNEEEYEMSIIQWYLNGGSPLPQDVKP